MTKCSNFLCLLVQLSLKYTKTTPIFVRLKAIAKIKTMTCRKLARYAARSVVWWQLSSKISKMNA